MGQPRWCVLDLSRVTRIDVGAASLLADLAETFQETGRELALCGAARHSLALAGINAALETAGRTPVRTFADADLAREWCEDEILELGHPEAQAGGAVNLADHELLRGVDEAGMAILSANLKRQRYVPGTVVVRRGEAADRLFLIASRLSTLSDGMVFGELALIGREARTADVRADTMVECQVLSVDDFERLTSAHPALACVLLTNLLRVVGRTARRMTGEVALLAG